MSILNFWCAANADAYFPSIVVNHEPFRYLVQVPKRAFKILFCERFRCPPSDYEQRVFRKCLYPHARLLAPLIRLLNPNFFTDDFKFVHYLGEATGTREVNAEMLAFQDTNRGKPSFTRTGLRIRVSGRKAAALAQRLLTEARRKPDSAPNPVT